MHWISTQASSIWESREILNALVDIGRLVLVYYAREFLHVLVDRGRIAF